ncbi:uncharacterized protein LOC132709546 [Pantherophis guttatus]|uniref:Uncharacterized protein LOC132709546 n=1 Tax=Pantherophis guttatus TaxID=94885 RepID=A0ABM3YTY0_PANGU|nr:uncharacterized protein LOC132709546 [Pantherophis guttatus]
MANPQAPITSLNPFDLAREKWRSYMVRFWQFLRGNSYQNLDDERKRALFLAHCGSDVLEMAIDLMAPRDIGEMSWSDLQEVLQEHYAPTGTPIANRFTFQQRSQWEGESIKVFVAALRQIAANCEFDNVDNAIRDCIVFGMWDVGLQKKFLSCKRIPLKEVLEEATAAETSEKAAAAMVKARGIHKIHKLGPNSSDDSATPSESDEEMAVHKVSRPPRRENPQHGDRGERCGSCKGDHPRANCRWSDATCHRCLKRGHIAEACRAADPAPEPPRPRFRENRKDTQRTSKRSSNQSRHGDDEYPHNRAVHQTTIAHTSDNGATKFNVTLLAEGSPCIMEVDSGSIYSIMDWQHLKHLKPACEKNQLKPLRSRLMDFRGNPIGVLGRTTLHIAFKEFQGNLPITVVEHSRPNLLGVEWFKPLGLSIGGIHQIQRDELDNLIEEFKEVFDESYDC